MSPNKSLQTKLTSVFDGFTMREKPPSPKAPGTPGTPGTPSTVLDTDSPNTELYSQENENINGLHEKIHSLQNENNILKKNLTNIEKTYQDVPIPSTEIADRNGNILYTLCPLTTEHPENALVFNERGIRVKKEKLFKDSPVLPPQQPQDSPNKSRKRVHKSSSPKTPSSRKTQKTPPSPGHKSKRQKH